MGDMIKCGRCCTFHYRNDPCPDEHQPAKRMDGLTQALQAIDRLGINRESVDMCTFSALDPPSITLKAAEFGRVFAGRVAELTPGSEGWERLELIDGGVQFVCVRGTESIIPVERVVV